MNTWKADSEIRENEAGGKEILTFPELVFKEFLAVLGAMIVLCIWSLLMDAPLKEIADPNWTENPAKAPWYFVGLQEVLVYFDPWIAGVCLPLLIITGLMSLPYMDPNPKGIGVYGFRDRPLAVSVFLYGFALWFGLILIGQFLRGPSWHFYWPWEDWTVGKAAEPALTNLSNTAGIWIISLYMAVGLIPATIYARKRFEPKERIKFMLAWMLILLMFGIPGKMLLRIFWQVRYLITTTHFSI